MGVEMMRPFITWVNQQSPQVHDCVEACVTLLAVVTEAAVGVQVDWVHIPNYWAARTAVKWVQQLAAQAGFPDAVAYCQETQEALEREIKRVEVMMHDLLTMEMGDVSSWL